MADPSKKVCVIIVAYNDLGHMERCLNSVLQSDYSSLEVAVIDNSPTNSLQKELEKYPVRYRHMGKNTGFCLGSNEGIKISMDLSAEYTLLLNHDTQIKPDCVTHLVGRAEGDQKVGIVTGKIYLMTGKNRIWYGGGYFSEFLAVGKNFGFNQVDGGQFDVPGEVTYSTGCCMLVPNRVFAAVGVLDPSLFMYFEDIQFGNRVRRAGYKIYYEPRAVLYHELGGGSDFRKRPDYYLYFMVRNRVLSVEKSFYRIYAFCVTFVLASVKIVMYAGSPNIEKRGSKLMALICGLIDCLSDKPNYRKRFPDMFS